MYASYGSFFNKIIFIYPQKKKEEANSCIHYFMPLLVAKNTTNTLGDLLWAKKLSSISNTLMPCYLPFSMPLVPGFLLIMQSRSLLQGEVLDDRLYYI